MFQDRLTPLARRRAFERIITPVVIRTEAGRLRDVVAEIAPVVEDIRERFPRIAIPEIPALGMFPFKIFPRFSMVSALLPREIIFHLAENRYIERIFPDEPMFALQYPTVKEEGTFVAPHRIIEEITFTTTFHTRRLLGANIANGQGFWGRDILVSVADTGGSRIHEQTRRMSFETSMKGQYTDANGHGQWCTSCVGGIEGVDEYLSQRTGRRVRCLGIAPECDLLSIKCLGYVVGMGMTSNIIDAMSTAIERGSDIISMSLGGPSQTERPEDDPFYPVLDEALKYNVIPVIAAGNSGSAPNTIGSPGCLNNCLTVGAYDPITGEIAGFSSRGPTNWNTTKPDCIAPGVNIDCLTKFTKILTPYGYKEILYIKPDSDIISFNTKTGKLELDKSGIVAKRKRRTNEKVYRITSNEGHIIEASEKHKFWVKRKNKIGWINAENLRINDSLFSDSHCPREDRVPRNVKLSISFKKTPKLKGANNPNWRGGRLVPCTNCNKQIWRTPRWFKTHKSGVAFCSKTCYDEWQRGRPRNEEFKKKMRDVTKGEKNPFYGRHHTKESKETMRKTKIERGLMSPRKSIECINCKKTFEVNGSSRRRFCSTECAYTYFRKTGFYDKVQKAGLESLKRKYGENYATILSQRGIKKLAEMSRLGSTKPEQIVENMLRLLSVDYVKQSIIPLKDDHYTVTDFVILNTKTAVYVDGAYWHSKSSERDGLITRELEEMGWKVIRIDEEETKNAQVILTRLTPVIDPIIVKIEEIGRVKELYDVEAQSNHTIIANGIVVHNSGCTGVCDRAGDGVQSRYSPISGTSMSCPHIAGLVALMRESMKRRIGKILTVDEIKNMLSELGHEKSNKDGYGVLDWKMWECYLSSEYGVEL